MDQVEHVLESFCTAVIRVGHIGWCRCTSKLEQGSNARVMPGWAAVEQRRVIEAIHREDQVEALEVRVLHLPRPQAREVYAAAGSRLYRARVGRFPDVIAMGARGVDLDVEPGSMTTNVLAQHAFRRGRPADIAHADEQDFHGFTIAMPKPTASALATATAGPSSTRICETPGTMSSNLSLAARVISEGFLPARSALLQGPREAVYGPIAADRIRGMLLGLAIGDALGNTSEGLSALERHAQYGEIRDYLPNSRSAGHRVGLPSDDSQLAFWTLESLLEREGLDLDDLPARFAAREIFGLGKAMQQFLRNREQGATSWYHCGAESAGNGALMRIAPLVLLHPQGTSAALWLDVALASIITHRDASSVASCVAFVDLLARLLRLPAPPTSEWIIATFLATVRQVCADQAYRPRGGTFAAREGSFPDYLEFVLTEAKRQGWSTQDACAAWCSGAYLLETVPSMLWILANHAHDPEEAIVRAVNDTHDNDTIAALVGAAVGALHGRDGLPAAWQRGLLGRTTANDDGRVFRLIEEAVRRDWL